MAKFVMTNVRVLIGGADLSGDTNEATLAVSKEIKDVTNYNSQGWKEVLGGLGQAKIDIMGYTEAGNLGLPDDLGFANVGLLGGITLAPQGAADGAIAYFTNVLESEYDPIQGKVGDVAAFKLNTVSDWSLVRGVIGFPPATVITSPSGPAFGTVNTFAGGVATGQQFYADLHIISVSGSPSITFSIQSAVTNFATITTRATFTVATAIGGQIIRIPGPITDTFWRVAYTTTGTGSVLASVAFGVA